MRKSVVIALSGGIDSATLLAWCVAHDYHVTCVSFNYGSKHNEYELICAGLIHEYYQNQSDCVGEHLVFDMKPIFESFNSSLLKQGGSIPEGHYTDESMSQTVVPARNIIFLSTLAGVAKSKKASTIGIGIHKGDHAIYADCRAEFYEAMDKAIYLGTDREVQIEAPFVDMTKADIVSYGMERLAPYYLTRTCYKDQPDPCGKCGACVERKEAFHHNGLRDPVTYEGEV